MIMLRVSNLTIAYPGKDVPVIKDFNFDLPKGSLCLVHGASGSGKTSLCLALAGSLLHAYPESHIGGSVTWDNSAIDQQTFNPAVAITLENPYAQLSGLKSTVESEIAFGLEMRGVQPEVIRQLIDTASSIFSITHLLKRNPRTLSGGEIQRLVIACSYVVSPDLWILDRPLTELDPAGRNLLLRILVSLSHEKGTTIILAEEPSPELDSVITHQLCLDNGALIINKTPLKTDFDNTQTIHSQFGIQFKRTTLNTFSNAALPFLVEVKDLAFRYSPDSPLILEDLSLSLRPGECLWVTGPNGCGKTTLAKLVMGILKTQKGEIKINGINNAVRPLWEIAKQVSYAFQNPDYQIFSGTVREEVSFGPRSLGYHPDKVDSLTIEALNLFGLTEKKKEHPHDLSRSERKRLGLASTFAMDTPVLILDEPTQYQDSKGKSLIITAMVEVLRKGKCILCITHDMLGIDEKYIHHLRSEVFQSFQR